VCAGWTIIALRTTTSWEANGLGIWQELKVARAMAEKSRRPGIMTGLVLSKNSAHAKAVVRKM
jgi:hypothetical protein